MWHELDRGIDGVELAERAIPVGVEIVGFRIASRVTSKLVQW
jgi:hypothetical protein